MIWLPEIPLITSLYVEKIGLAALGSFCSEASLAVVAGGMYEFLPMPVRLVANREVFVNFCVGNLDKILPDAAQPSPRLSPKTKNKKIE